MDYDDRISLPDLLLCERALSALCDLSGFVDFPTDPGQVRPYFAGNWSATWNPPNAPLVSWVCLFSPTQIVIVCGGTNRTVLGGAVAIVGFQGVTFSAAPLGAMPLGVNYAAEILRQCTAAGANFNEVPCWLFGHSLGGLICTILSSMLAQPVGPAATRCFTFGSPKPGNAQFAGLVDSRVVTSIRNSTDFVCRYPPGPGDVEDFLSLSLTDQSFLRQGRTWAPSGRGIVLRQPDLITSANLTPTLTPDQYTDARAFSNNAIFRPDTTPHSQVTYRNIIRSIIARIQSPVANIQIPGQRDPKDEPDWIDLGDGIRWYEGPGTVLDNAALLAQLAVQAAALPIPLSQRVGRYFSPVIPMSAPSGPALPPPDPGGSVNPSYPAGFPPKMIRTGPASGPQSGGTTVSIRGANLGVVTEVYFGQVPAMQTRRISNELLLAVVPPQLPGIVRIFLRWPGGYTIPNRQFQFQYTAAGATPLP